MNRPTVSAMRDLQAQVMRLQMEQSTFRPFAPVAWTGGSVPPSPSLTPMHETALRRAMFRQQVNQWRAHWKDSPDWDTFRIYFRRARMDSFASFRSALNR